MQQEHEQHRRWLRYWMRVLDAEHGPTWWQQPDLWRHYVAEPIQAGIVTVGEHARIRAAIEQARKVRAS